METTRNDELIKTIILFEKVQTTSFYLIIGIILIGLIGNSITIFVFAQKRFRINSSHVYHFALALIDNLYLITYLIEDTLKYYEHKINPNSSTFVEYLLRFDLTCRLIHYLKYVLRLISAYIVVAFTLQRLIIVMTPLKSQKFKSKKLAIRIILILISISLLLNAWVPFIFSSSKECKPDNEWSQLYMQLTFVHLFLILFLPTLVIIVCNTIMACRSKKADKKRQVLKNNNGRLQKRRMRSCKNIKLMKLKPHYVNIQHVINRMSYRENTSAKMTTTWMFISFSHFLLNMPYLITWLWRYFSHNDIDDVMKIYFISSVKIAEVFNVLNYSLNFYIYCFSGSLFRKQLKYSGNLFNYIV